MPRFRPCVSGHPSGRPKSAAGLRELLIREYGIDAREDLQDAAQFPTREAALAGALIFPEHHRDAFRELLEAGKLRRDPKSGFERNFESLRATAISFRILNSPDLNLEALASGVCDKQASPDAWTTPGATLAVALHLFCTAIQLSKSDVCPCARV